MHFLKIDKTNLSEDRLIIKIKGEEVDKLLQASVT